MHECSSVRVVGLVLIATGWAHAAPPTTTAAEPPATAPAAGVVVQAVPGTALKLEFVPVAGEGEVGNLLVSRTEITWDLYDTFVYGLDQSAKPTPEGADAITRPSKPYISMDRGFGHSGYPAISMSPTNAQAFCKWLSAKIGLDCRLPTVAEWRHLCQKSGLDAAAPETTWSAQNAERVTHVVGSLNADDLGLHDLWGNAAEWCIDQDGDPVAMGGCYLDETTTFDCDRGVEPTPQWNDSDPQFPKSTWWYADAGFVGVRVVCEKKADPPR